jgi:hypothetical protein
MFTNLVSHRRFFPKLNCEMLNDVRVGSLLLYLSGLYATSAHSASWSSTALPLQTNATCFGMWYILTQALDIAYTTVNSNTAPGPSPPLSVLVGARHKPSACTDKEDRSSSGSYDLRVRFKVELRGISWEALVINAVSQLPTPFSRSQQ